MRYTSGAYEISLRKAMEKGMQKALIAACGKATFDGEALSSRPRLCTASFPVLRLMTLYMTGVCDALLQLEGFMNAEWDYVGARPHQSTIVCFWPCAACKDMAADDAKALLLRKSSLLEHDRLSHPCVRSHAECLGRSQTSARGIIIRSRRDARRRERPSSGRSNASTTS